MLLDDVATLGGGATTLRDGVVATLGDAVLGWCSLGRPAMIEVSWQIASRCLSLALAVVEIVLPSCLKILAATRSDLSCLDVTGT
jgi:hypothetical protein